MTSSYRFCKRLGSMLHSSPGRNFRTVVIEGNIASGKTVLLEHFRKVEHVKTFPEPVEKWRNLNGQNLLDLLYRDSSRWSFTFQMYADLTRLCLHQSSENLMPGDVKLMERSLFSGKYVFAENSYRSGNMAQAEYEVLNSYFQWLIDNQSEMLKVDLLVYLRTRPEICHQRLLKRCRKEEMAIPLEYLTRLHELYEQWLIEKKYPVPAEVMVIDANDELPSMYKVYEELATKVLSSRDDPSHETMQEEPNRPVSTTG